MPARRAEPPVLQVLTQNSSEISISWAVREQGNCSFRFWQVEMRETPLGSWTQELRAVHNATL